MFFLDHLQPTPNILYYFQAFEKLMVENKWLDGHLSHHVLRQQEEEQCWPHLKDYYQPTFYMTHSPFLFWIPYGDNTLFTICRMDWARVIPRSKEWGHESPSKFWILNDHISATQD